MNEQMNMSISGSSSMPGGEYDKVSISGAGTVKGNLRCTRLHCSGAAEIEGDVCCTEEIRSSGAVRIAGSAQCGQLSASGSFHVETAMQVQTRASVSGSVQIGTQLTADEISASGCLQAGSVRCRSYSGSGSCRISGDLEAETVSLSGGVEISGLLNAESVALSPNRLVRIGAIGGGQIRILPERTSGFLGLFRSTPDCARIGTIEGDDVELEYVEAEIVRGRNVRIGKGCRIGHVEYGAALTAEPGTVGSSTQTGAE